MHSRPRRSLPVICLPVSILLLYLMFAVLPDLRSSVPEWIGLSAVIIVLLSATVFLSRSFQTDWSAGFILSIAAILRLMFLWRSPELSDDIFRYLFDGLMFLNGHNPYAFPPADVQTANPILSELIRRINHPELPTIYPPSAQFVFAAGAVIGSITGMKFCLVVLDLLGCVLILYILNRLNLPRANAVLYAWHPLPVMEIAASGHIDVAAIFFTFLTIAFLLSEKSVGQSATYGPGNPSDSVSSSALQGLRGFTAGILFSLAVLIKWVPLIFLPGILLMTCSGARKYAVYGLLTGSAAMIGLFWPEIQNGFQTLTVYAANWEFAGFAFRRLRSTTGSGETARLLLAAGFAAVMGSIYFRYFKSTRLSPLLKKREIIQCIYATVFAFLLLTPTLHPWYALYLVAFLPFAAGPAGIVFSWSILLAYRVAILYGMTGQWVESDFIPLLIVIGPAMAAAAGTILRPAIRKPGSDIARYP